MSAILPLRMPLTMITRTPDGLLPQLIDLTFGSRALLSCFRPAMHTRNQRSWRPSRDEAAARWLSGADAAGQRGQLAVEALGLLQVRQVADTFVPRGLGGRADGEDVLGHRRKHDRIGTALGN